MGLVDLWNSQEWEPFWFNNWISHQGIVQAISAQKGIQLQMYPIDRWNQDGAEGLLLNHYLFHLDMNLVLGLDGQDLSTLDFKDEKMVQAWTYQNFMEHQAAYAALKPGPNS